MYIKYITPQRVADPKFTEYHSSGGPYKPTWLVRTSDWKKVPGHKAVNGYHTLSYCWEQSGEIIPKDGDDICIDNGLHRVVKIEKMDRSIFTWFRGQKTTVTHVTYDKLLQQICKDFDIEYLWYDKMCIDQSNKAEKQREIKQMHRIYGNARYTVALVPEINIADPKEFDTEARIFNFTEAKSTAIRQMCESLWFQRSWTLEELMMSTRILVIGRNTHFWSLADIKQGKTSKEKDMLSNIMLGFPIRKLKSANQVLAYAHRRTCAKEHDRVFSLANIFNDTVSIDIDYDSKVSTVANSFYKQLAQHDLSILCFGLLAFPPNGKPATTMTSYGLPSWTGIGGVHSNRTVVDNVLDEGGFWSIDDSMLLHIRCRSHTIRPIKCGKNNVFADQERRQQASRNRFKAISSLDDFYGDETEALDWGQYCMGWLTGLMPTHYAKPDAACCSPIMSLSLNEKCDECVVLGVLSTIVIDRIQNEVVVGYTYSYVSPVLKKSINSPTYKVVGVILLKHFQYDEPRKSPEDFMDEMFKQLDCSEYRDFCIN